MARARRHLTRTQLHGARWRNRVFPDYRALKVHKVFPDSPVPKVRKGCRDYRARTVRRVRKAYPDYPALKGHRDSPVYQERPERKDCKEFPDLRDRLAPKDLRARSRLLL